MHRCSPEIQYSLIFLNQQNYFFSLLRHLCLWGTFPSQFSCLCFSNILLLNTGHLPSRIFSMGHSLLPLLAAFIAHYISHSYRAQNFTQGTFPSRLIMRYLSFPFHNFLDSWGTCPSHSHL